ncbi:hypothetical protein QCA50_006497 [Cerrena zonata]|uniref:Uncharacterized protein n=1 Tax=Cerrena zonata TaxID=2478898 RepID=A0AAW0G891_9APHY
MPSVDPQSSDITHQVELLEKLIKSIRTSFSDVSLILDGISNNPTLPSASRPEVSGLQSRWQQIQSDLRCTIWKARDAAGRAQTFVTDFLMFIDHSLIYPKDDGIPNKTAFSEYRISIKAHQCDSGEVEQRFKKLYTDIDVFKNEWKKSIHNHKLSRYIHIKSFQGSKEFEKRIKSLKGKVLTLSLTLLSALGLVAASTFLSITQGRLDVTADVLQGFADQVSRFWGGIQKVWSEKKRVIVDIGEEGIQNVADTVYGFQKVWALIIADLEFMERQLEVIEKGDNNRTRQLQERVERARIEYPKLRSVLRDFQVTNF